MHARDRRSLQPLKHHEILVIGDRFGQQFPAKARAALPRRSSRPRSTLRFAVPRPLPCPVRCGFVARRRSVAPRRCASPATRTSPRRTSRPSGTVGISTTKPSLCRRNASTNTFRAYFSPTRSASSFSALTSTSPPEAPHGARRLFVLTQPVDERRSSPESERRPRQPIAMRPFFRHRQVRRTARNALVR